MGLQIILFNMQSLTAGGGLQNLGNTCFFNATLQSLLHTPALARVLHSQHHSQGCQVQEWCVFCEMENVFAKTRQNRCFAPNNMIANLKKIFKKFKLGRQQDSHQFLRYLVEGMQEAETGKLTKDREENQKKIRNTKIFSIFGGVIKTCVQCLSCSHKSITAERYYDFNISQECQRADSLSDGVSSFFTVDRLEGSNRYLCEHCKVRSNARKSFVLESLPQVATFQLKRFTNNMRKIGKFMQYPFEVDLGRYLEHPRQATLKLFAIIVHAGRSSFSGHYYAFVRVATTWYKMDDGHVSKCSYDSVMNQQAYILFYEREGKQSVEGQPNGLKKDDKSIEIQIIGRNQLRDQAKEGVGLQRKEEKKVFEPQRVQVKNGINGKYLQNGVRHTPPKEQNNPSIDQQNVTSKEMAQIEQILISKLASCELFKGMSQEQQTFTAIQKAVKQAIQEATPKKAQQKKEEMQIEEPSIRPVEMEMEEPIVVPIIQRRKSKEDLEREIPYSELVLRTVEKILELEEKIPSKKPHNYSQRSMYNLRKYESTMQKKRKLG